MHGTTAGCQLLQDAGKPNTKYCLALEFSGEEPAMVPGFFRWPPQTVCIDLYTLKSTPFRYFGGQVSSLLSWTVLVRKSQETQVLS